MTRKVIVKMYMTSSFGRIQRTCKLHKVNISMSPMCFSNKKLKLQQQFILYVTNQFTEHIIYKE